MRYELWDNKHLNLIDDFADEEAALAAIRAVVQAHGRDAVANWALDCSDRSVQPLAGAALVARALKTVPSQA